MTRQRYNFVSFNQSEKYIDMGDMLLRQDKTGYYKSKHKNYKFILTQNIWRIILVKDMNIQEKVNKTLIIKYTLGVYLLNHNT